MTARTIGSVLPWLLIIAIAAFAVSVDLHNDEVQAAVLVIVVGGFLIGAGWPAGAWRWALMLGLSILVGEWMAPRLGWIARDVAPPNWGALVALIPAFLGTYMGVGVRSLARRVVP
jgi:hypothetical protein